MKDCGQINSSTPALRLTSRNGRSKAMDFEDTAAEAAFREEARAWLEANVPSEDEMAGMDGMARAKFWQKRKADGGWACIRWPEEYGGRGADAIQQVILGQEEAR